ncbi:MAG: hypothetical protein WAL71_07240 [Terriglobales bacterium]|jgi:hypothetical protein
MTAANPSVLSSTPSLVDLAESDLPEIAAFVAEQSGQAGDAVLDRLTWLLLENPARHKLVPLGCGVRSTSGALVGCILYLPQVFTFGSNPILLLGSTCFYVNEFHRGFGGALFLKFTRIAQQWPIFGNSANAIAAQLWKARCATPIAHSDHELLGVVNWPPVVEEVIARRVASNRLARAVGAATACLRHVRNLRLPRDPESCLVRLSSVEEVMELPLLDASDCFSALRNESYIRWRYFSQRDPSISLFAFRNRKTPRCVFIAVNERRRGQRRQIRALNLLDAFPKPDPEALAAILGALHEKYRDNVDVIVARCLDAACQNALLQAGFRRREFEAPNGWLLDRRGVLPPGERYFIPADGDWII